MDTFFVSVERLRDPHLCGRPVVVGGRPGQRGVVTSASYEARALGVRSGMSMTEAVRRAPKAVFMPTRHGAYSTYTEGVKRVLQQFCPVVQTASIDEFFLDFRGCERVYAAQGDANGDAAIVRAVRRMRRAIQEQVGLPASAGVGGTRVVAKMASRDAKPAGECLVPVGAELAFVSSRPVQDVPGIGPRTAAYLDAAGVRTIGQLLSARGADRIGQLALNTRRRLLEPHRLGEDRPAFREHDPRGSVAGSISNERTFPVDVRDRARVEAQLRALAERVCWRARRRGVRARTVSMKLRSSTFQTTTRRRTLAPTDEERRVGDLAVALFDAHWDRRPVRLVGVELSGFVAPAPQLALPLASESCAPVGPAVDAIRERFGFDAIRFGVTTRDMHRAAEPIGGVRGGASR